MKHLIWITSAALMIGGCEALSGNGDDHANHADATAADVADGKVATATLAPSKAATTQPSNNNVHGTVTFTQTPDGKVHVVAHVTGLTANSQHGFHIHEKGDLSAPDLTSAGPHFNPQGHKHGGPESDAAHAGDLGNIRTDAGGNAHLEITLDNVTLGDGANSIAGRSVIVHARTDDLATDPAGNAGARVAGGIIEIKN